MITQKELENFGFSKYDSGYSFYLNKETLDRIIFCKSNEFKFLINGCCILNLYPESIEELKLFIKVLGYEI